MVYVEYNGDRKWIPVKDCNNIMLQSMLEMALLDFKLEASIDFQLEMKGKCLNSMANISNQSVLKLVKIECKNIRVCIQSLDGKRKIGHFKSTCSLSFILNHFQMEKGNVLYMRREIPMDSLENTTLQHLGLYQGSALIRLTAASSQNESTVKSNTSAAASSLNDLAKDSNTRAAASSQNDSAINSNTSAAAISQNDSAIDSNSIATDQNDPKVDSKPIATDQNDPTGDFNSIATDQNAQAINSKPSATDQNDPKVDSGKNTIGMEGISASDGVLETRENASRVHGFENGADVAVKSSCYDAIQHLRDHVFDQVACKVIVLLMRILSNVLSNPEDEKFRSIRTSSGVFRNTIEKQPGAMRFLKCVGFVLSDDAIVLKDVSEEVLMEGWEVLIKETLDLGIDQTTLPVIKKKVEFNPYQVQITRTMAQPRGESVTERKVQELQVKKNTILAADPPPRQIKVFENQSVLDKLRKVKLNDDDAEGTTSDAILLATAMRQKQKQAEKGQMFRTRAMVELELLERKRVFTETIIRIEFPNRSILQAHFHPLECIVDVQNVVKQCLHASLPNEPFYLYVSPPVQKLNADDSIEKAGLVPAALVYISFINRDVHNTPCFLKSDLVTQDTMANEKTVQSAIAYPQSNILAPKQPAINAPQAEAKKGKSKTLKWLKL